MIDTKGTILIINNQDSEDRWEECQEVGLYAFWNGPAISDIHKLIDWIEVFCGSQVCITHYSDRIIFIHYCDEIIKKEFLRVSNYMFRGHAVHFFDWIPNCCINNLDFSTQATWFEVKSLPPELNQINILKRIGRSLGDFIGLDFSYEKRNYVRILTKSHINNTNLKPIRLITNRSSYNLKFQKYEGKILDIIRLDDESKYSFNMISKTSDLNRTLAFIRRRQINMGLKEQDLKYHMICHNS